MPSIVETLIEEGRQEGIQEDILKLLRKGILTPGEIADALEVDLSLVRDLAKTFDR